MFSMELTMQSDGHGNRAYRGSPGNFQLVARMISAEIGSFSLSVILKAAR